MCASGFEQGSQRTLKATVVITTKNRQAELRAALASTISQSARPEVVVIDDGSSDGTAEMIHTEFPTVVLHHREQSRGCIARRNEGARLATGGFIFSLDDDAVFSTPNVVEQTLRDFDNPHIGAVAIPYLEPLNANRLMQQAPGRDCVWITDRFIGTSHAVRREIFLKLGGYREHLVHQGEEGDFCLRMLQAGHFVRLGNSDPIHHFESPRRDFQRMDYYGARNGVLFAWQNVPNPVLPLHLAVTTMRCLAWTLALRRLWIRSGGVLAGYASLGRVPREPVSLETYRLFGKLSRQGPQRFNAHKVKQ